MTGKENTHTPVLIFRYIAKKHLKTVLLTSIALSLVWLLADSLEMSRRLSSKDVSEMFLLKMVACKAAGVYLEILPFSVLIGSLLCFSSLARSNELVAIRSSGISVWQFLRPALAISFVIGLLGILIINPIAASTQKKYESLEYKVFPNKVRGLIVDGQQLWLKYVYNDQMVVLHANKVLKRGLALEDVSVFIYDENNRLLKRIDSEKALLVQIVNDHHWFIEKGFEIEFELDSVKRRAEVENVKIPTEMTPEKIQLSFSSFKTISVLDLPAFINSLETSGFSTLRYQVVFWNTLFLPLLCMAMFILAAPFSLRFSRRGGVGRLLLVGLCFGFVFYMFNNVILTLAQAGRLNIFIAIIIPIIIAGLTGVYMLLHFREE
ncbi:MAG: LPS export ABC transporter permease LptG [Proteobacteria bacterium]|nr:LPS export ABC transporter permease LptG [Pseudomonadota bacterium]